MGHLSLNVGGGLDRLGIYDIYHLMGTALEKNAGRHDIYQQMDQSRKCSNINFTVSAILLTTP